jgi:hypothetical protein
MKTLQKIAMAAFAVLALNTAYAQSAKKEEITKGRAPAEKSRELDKEMKTLPQITSAQASSSTQHSKPAKVKSNSSARFAKKPVKKQAVSKKKEPAYTR